MKLSLPFCTALLLCSTAAIRGDGQLTVLGSTGLQTWTSFPLQIRTFTAEQVQQPPEKWLLRLCESIDNSNLVVIGDFFPAAGFQAVFSEQAVCKSLTSFWSRGGTLFWGLLSWDIIASFPTAMTGFFKEHAIPYPTTDSYHDPGKGKEVSLRGIPAPGYDGPLLTTAEQKPMTLTAIRHFGRLPAKTFKPVVVARENQDWPLIVMADGILGKGRMICNYCYNLGREANHPFYVNLVTHAYGPLVQHSAKEILRKRLQQVVGKESPAAAVRLWTPRPFQRIYSDTFPDSDTPPLPTLEIVAARNDSEAAQVLVTNFSEDNLYFRVEPQFLLADGATCFSELLSIREAIPWRATTGQVVLSPLSRLNQAGVLAVPPLETRMLWLEVKTLLPPGKYSWSCQLTPVNADVPKHDIKLNAEILDLTFPNPLPVGSYTFGPYGYSFAYNKHQRRQYFQTCLDYHINFLQTVDGPLRALKEDGTISSDPADYQYEEKLLLELGANWVYGYGVVASFQNTLKRFGHDYDLSVPAVQEKFRAWISNWAKTLRSDDVPFSRFLVPLQDEPAAKDIDNLLIGAKIIHEVNPAFQTTVTIATWSTRADIEKLAPAIDVWIPWEPRLTMRAEGSDELVFYQQQGKPFMTYLCSTAGNMAPYLDYFRFRGIRAFLHGTDHFALWAFNSWRQNPWTSSEDKEKSGAFLFLNGTEGPVPTIRAEWFREAAEDLYLLTLAAKSSNPEAKALADPEHLRKLLDANDEQQPENVNAWRIAITRALATKP